MDASHELTFTARLVSSFDIFAASADRAVVHVQVKLEGSTVDLEELLVLLEMGLPMMSAATPGSTLALYDGEHPLFDGEPWQTPRLTAKVGDSGAWEVF